MPGGRDYKVAAIFDAKDNLSGVAASVAGNVESSGKRIGQSLEANSRKIERMGTVFMAAGGAVVAGAGLMGKSAADVEDRISKLGTIFDETDVKAQNMAGGINFARREFGTAGAATSEALYQIGSASIQATDALDVLNVSAKGSVGGFTDVLTAADGTTSALNAWKLEATSAGLVMDKFVMAQNKGKLTVDDMAHGMGIAATQAAAMGVSLDEVSAIAATATANGTRAETAFHDMAGAFAAVNRPAAELADRATKVGVAFDSATYATLSTVEKLQYLAEISDGDVGKLQGLIGSLEASRSALAITGENAKVFSDNLAAIKDSAGATDEAFKKMSETSSFRFRQMKEQLAITGETVGSAFLPAMQGAATAVGWVAGAMEKLTANPIGRFLAEAIGGLGAATFAFGSLMVGITKANQAITSVREGWRLMGSMVSWVRGLIAAKTATTAADSIAEGVNAGAKTANAIATTAAAGAVTAHTGALGTNAFAATASGVVITNMNWTMAQEVFWASAAAGAVGRLALAHDALAFSAGASAGAQALSSGSSMLALPAAAGAAGGIRGLISAIAGIASAGGLAAAGLTAAIGLIVGALTFLATGARWSDFGEGWGKGGKERRRLAAEEQKRSDAARDAMRELQSKLGRKATLEERAMFAPETLTPGQMQRVQRAQALKAIQMQDQMGTMNVASMGGAMSVSTQPITSGFTIGQETTMLGGEITCTGPTLDGILAAVRSIDSKIGGAEQWIDMGGGRYRPGSGYETGYGSQANGGQVTVTLDAGNLSAMFSTPYAREQLEQVVQRIAAQASAGRVAGLPNAYAGFGGGR